MRRCFAAMFAIGAVSLAAPCLAGNWTAIERLNGGTPVTVEVRDHPRIYFRVTPRTPVVIPVAGPARFRAISRAEIGGGGAVVTYTLTATEKGKVLETLETETSAADDVRLASGARALGKSRRMTFDVPAGTHAVTLSLGGASVAYVRVQISTRKGEEPMVSLTPINAPRSVTVNEGQKLITYHSALPGQPVTVRVVGPTSLELLSRIDYAATMRGSQSYRLRISEGRMRIKDLAIKTTKAVAATYTNLPDRTPSKFTLTRLSVPDGSHEYVIDLIEPAHGAAEIHARIPAPSVGSEE